MVRLRHPGFNQAEQLVGAGKVVLEHSSPEHGHTEYGPWHLHACQSGSTGLGARIRVDPATRSAPRTLAPGVTSALASPDMPMSSARLREFMPGPVAATAMSDALFSQPPS